MHIDTIAVLRAGPNAPFPLISPSSIVYDTRRHTFAAFQEENAIVEFDSAGYRVATLMRTAAPEDLRLIIDAADSLFVFNNSRERFSVFGPDRRLARTGAFGAKYMLAAERLSSGEFLVAADIRTPSSVGFPLHIVDANGGLHSSFGSPDTAFLAGAFGASAHIVAGAPDGTFWTTPHRTLQLRHWDRSVSPLEQFEFEGGKPNSWQRKPLKPVLSFLTSRALDVHVDACGLLWIVSNVPAEVPWGNAGIESVSVGGRGPQLRVRFPDRTYRTVIDVVDTRNARYIASLLLPINIVRILPDDKAVAMATDNSGRWHTAIVRVRLDLASVRAGAGIPC